MATIDIQGFAAAADSIALRIDAARLPGLLRRSLVVPERCVALIRDADGRDKVLRAGAEETGAFTGILVKDGEVAVPLQIGALPTKEGHPTVAGLEVVIAITSKPI